MYEEGTNYRSPFDDERIHVAARRDNDWMMWIHYRNQFARTGKECYLNYMLDQVSLTCPPDAPGSSLHQDKKRFDSAPILAGLAIVGIPVAVVFGGGFIGLIVATFLAVNFAISMVVR